MGNLTGFDEIHVCRPLVTFSDLEGTNSVGMNSKIWPLWCHFCLATLCLSLCTLVRMSMFCHCTLAKGILTLAIVHWLREFWDYPADPFSAFFIGIFLQFGWSEVNLKIWITCSDGVVIFSATALPITFSNPVLHSVEMV